MERLGSGLELVSESIVIGSTGFSRTVFTCEMLFTCGRSGIAGWGLPGYLASRLELVCCVGSTLQPREGGTGSCKAPADGARQDLAGNLAVWRPTGGRAWLAASDAAVRHYMPPMNTHRWLGQQYRVLGGRDD